ncbi:uncharacterized protein MONOS_13626 [Monocercomonoides exilis]|uniref:uncharacterized protein n=1 Tax=Monocercomonoides exilis TaxID=2049356 RepID=UPI003559CC08|nr:hypothetical protein MONOS_13626 [Monocercomonoides exilis]|eukprot:MONOS_13626.1-p1 / transcript=MONOS_13626.1 / gene=MONOS_13626 / organism=Monocercomonoides_exilis_PA203 / gene_product=unspecified product / transcript_product=unspecified product / location=Mono_scaffold00855:18269-19549(-) / protein_length=406 / sequence_SO=supercontig / SO=protein_coding / is_pseudo=false
MKRVIDEMNKEELYAFFKTDLFNKIHEMIEEKKLSLENAILVLKHIGHCKVLKHIWNNHFKESSLDKRFEKMIIEEEKKKEEKNEKLLIDLCECYLLLNRWASEELLSTGVSCLLKVALNKEENEEAQKEVEIVLLALSGFGYGEVEQELFINEIKEVIQYHQKHHNLTRLACQSSWQFLINGLPYYKSFEGVIVDELHFLREAERELEELMKSVNRKREKEAEKEEKETKKELVLLRWLNTLERYFLYCTMWNEEFVGLLNSIVRVFLAAKDNNREVSLQCIHLLKEIADNRVVKIEDLLKGGAVDVVLEEFQRPTLNDEITSGFLECFDIISSGLYKTEDEKEEEEKVKEEERKEMKMKMFEKMEEEGYEDIITSLNKLLDFLSYEYYYYSFSSDIADYFVNV